MITRHCQLHQDQEALKDLWLAYRIATSVEVYPTIWRLRLLLTSRVWEPALDTRIWETEAGQIAGFAMLWRRQLQSPHLVLDYFAHPSAATPKLVESILKWGTQRARTIAQTNRNSLTLFTSNRYNFTHADQRLEALGFEPTPPNDQEYNIYFAHTLKTELLKPSFPERYTVQLLQTSDNIEAYNALYDFAAVNPQHLEELLTSDEYHHRVVTDPNGEFVAYCEYSICRAEWQLSNQRLGWIDYIGTRPENQRQGLGLALVLSSLQHLKTQGADTAMLVTVSSNKPAIGLYHQAGFNSVTVSGPPSFQMSILAE